MVRLVGGAAGVSCVRGSIQSSVVLLVLLVLVVLCVLCVLFVGGVVGLLLSVPTIGAGMDLVESLYNQSWNLEMWNVLTKDQY